MLKITVLPHKIACPNGTVIYVNSGNNLCDILLKNKIEIEHACGKSCACATCHVIIKKGFNSLDKPSYKEENLLDSAWGLQINSRLSCQVIIKKKNLTIEIPKYTLNQVILN